MKMKKICVIGCSGFIGSHLVDRLLKENRFYIVGIDKACDKIQQCIPHPLFEFHKKDAAVLSECADLVQQCDIVISLAAICNPVHYNTIPLEVIQSNFTAPLQLVQFCAAYDKWLIHFSTSEIYGKTIQGIGGSNIKKSASSEIYLLGEDTAPLILGPVSAQRWSYAAAKQLLERVIFAYGTENKLRYTIIRPFNFIGPRMDFIPGIDGEGVPRVLACFIDALLFGKPLQLVNGGSQKRAFTAIDDAIDAIVKIITQPHRAQQQIFNIGNPDNEITIRGLAEQMITIYTSLYPDMKIHTTPITIPAEQLYGKGYDDSDRRVPDITKAQQLLKWKPTVPLYDILYHTIRYYKDYYDKACAA